MPQGHSPVPCHTIKKVNKCLRREICRREKIFQLFRSVTSSQGDFRKCIAVALQTREEKETSNAEGVLQSCYKANTIPTGKRYLSSESPGRCVQRTVLSLRVDLPYRKRCVQTTGSTANTCSQHKCRCAGVRRSQRERRRDCGRQRGQRSRLPFR